MKSILYLLLFIQLTSCTNAQDKKQQHIAVCQQGNGCEIMEIKSSASEVDKALGKTGFWSKAPDNATLVIENCNSRLEEKLSLSEVHQSYGGTGEPKKINSFDIQKYLKEKGCLSNSNCANATKKISFHISSDEQSGNGYFFLNLKAGEAYMPDAAFQQLMAGQVGTEHMVIDQFMRNNALETYSIAEGKKYRHSMPIGTNMALIQNDAINEKRFKNDFRKTGNTRKHLNTSNIETEHTGKDDDGKTINFWITPVNDVCLPKGKFDAWGFYNLGYISVDGISYLVTEISGSGFQIKLTGISDGSYNFNPAGYQSY
ncbi:MAG TPA: hypothetical protein PKX92_09980 [Edaphocola sp.]|nr:hypothetical protein [Edaphocola sp.]